MNRKHGIVLPLLKPWPNASLNFSNLPFDHSDRFPRGSLNFSDIPVAHSDLTLSTSQPENPTHLSASMRPSVLKFSKLAQAQPDAQPTDLESTTEVLVIDRSMLVRCFGHDKVAHFFEDFPVLSLFE